VFCVFCRSKIFYIFEKITQYEQRSRSGFIRMYYLYRDIRVNFNFRFKIDHPLGQE